MLGDSHSFRPQLLAFLLLEAMHLFLVAMHLLLVASCCHSLSLLPNYPNSRWLSRYASSLSDCHRHASCWVSAVVFILVYRVGQEKSEVNKCCWGSMLSASAAGQLSTSVVEAQALAITDSKQLLVRAEAGFLWTWKVTRVVHTRVKCATNMLLT